MTRLPEPLEMLGEEFRHLGEPDSTRPPLRTRGRRSLKARRALLGGVALALLCVGVAAGGILISQGPPLPAPNAQDLRSSGVPIPATARLAGLDVPDPDASAPAWELRISRTRAGETCTAVGQVVNGQFGIVGLDRVFRALPLGGVDACGVESPYGPVLAGARVFAGGQGVEARTVVNGVAGSGTRSVTAYGPDGARRLALGPQGSFLTVYRGYVEDVRPRIVVVNAHGHSHTVAFAASSAFEVADPDGASPWQMDGGRDVGIGPGAHVYPDENCAQATEMLGRSDPGRFDAPMTPSVCGRLGARPLFALMRRFVPGSGEHSGYPWGNNPARTLVYGAAATRVAALTLTGAPGGPRSLPIDTHGGVFLAVLDGHVDPRALTLVAHLRDGRTLSYTHSTGLLDQQTNRPLPEAPVPAYRDPVPSRHFYPPPDLPIAATVRQTLRVSDPAGGPQWALRSWQGKPNPQAPLGGRPPSRFLCVQVGVLRAGQLLERRTDGKAKPLLVGENGNAGTGGCTDPGSLQRFGTMTEARAYVDDPYAYSPRPLRTVVSGLLPPGASHPMLIGAGTPLPLQTDPNGAFLVVLDGRFWDAPLRVSVREKGRTIVPPARSTVPVSASLTVPQARTPDPRGGAPWGYAATPDSTAEGRIVDGRLAYISEWDGSLRNGPIGWGGGMEPACQLRHYGGHCRHRLPGLPRTDATFDVQGQTEQGPPEEAQPLSLPQIQRRTLPGRTTISGRADADVVSITLATPRDVRTVRPSGPQHVFIVVYDGQFFRGSVTATLRLRDGHTVTQPVMLNTGSGEERRPPSLAAMLRIDLRQIAAMRANRKPLPKDAPGNPLAALGAEVRAIRARLSYERAHPGVLPAD